MATNGSSNGSAATSNGHNTHNIAPKITLYTNHRCPYAQRAHITLDTLNLPYDEVLIDLDTPRPQWYLDDINPRGLVPAIKYSVPGVFDKEEIITESGIVVQFLCDSFPSPLLPGSKESPFSALKRARIAFFVDTWTSKIAPFQYQIMLAAPGEEKEGKTTEWLKVIEKEIEPLLADAAPFFGGSGELTLAEVMVAPFLLRWFALARDGEVVPRGFGEGLERLPGFERWARAVVGEEMVRRVWDEEGVVATMKKRVRGMANDQIRVFGELQ
ncbi:hypothetical protein B0A55_01216 [Friedmanniomyces simplex]|uniref:GST N-terminal domain-containing protein n=1 Tax=Friedmanniomyces simplex TaxID=329884 RepID=A0A4U0XZX1_9PEZI|nr:hypothetical protein B0A55_01216 [Friedmanniomyces simplex]